MANAASLLDLDPMRVLIVGQPGAGKTPSLVPLINMGYKVRMLDFDGNLKSMLKFANKDMLAKNVDIVTLQDKQRADFSGLIISDGQPTAFTQAMDLIQKGWKYKNPDGSETDLGKATEWGPDTIIVLDSLTRMGDAAMRKALSMNNRTMQNRRLPDWGLAIAQQQNFLTMLLAKNIKAHVIVIAHLKLVSPKELGEDEDATNQRIKEKRAQLVPTRLYPSALGDKLPPDIAGMFETVLLAERRVSLGKERRVLTTDVGEQLDVKVPAAGLPKEIDIYTDGLLPVFKAVVPWSVEAVKAANDNAPPKEAAKVA